MSTAFFVALVIVTAISSGVEASVKFHSGRAGSTPNPPPPPTSASPTSPSPQPPAPSTPTPDTPVPATPAPTPQPPTPTPLPTVPPVIVWTTRCDVNNGYVAKTGSRLFFSALHTVTALNATTGALQWQYNAPGMFDGRQPIVAEYGVLLVPSFGMNQLVAMNITTGDGVWTYNVPNASCVLSARNDTVFCTSNGYAVAVDVKTGVGLWTFPFEHNHTVVHPPVILKDVIVVACGSNIYQVDAETGKNITVKQTLRAPILKMAGAAGALFVVFNGPVLTIRAIDPALWVVVWHTYLSDYTGIASDIKYSASAMSLMFVATSPKGTSLLSVGVSKGDTFWSVDGAVGTPTHSGNGYVYAGYNDGSSLVAITVVDGTIAGKIDFEANTLGLPPSAVGATAVYASVVNAEQASAVARIENLPGVIPVPPPNDEVRAASKA